MAYQGQDLLSNFAISTYFVAGVVVAIIGGVKVLRRSEVR